LSADQKSAQAIYFQRVTIFFVSLLIRHSENGTWWDVTVPDVADAQFFYGNITTCGFHIFGDFGLHSWCYTPVAKRDTSFFS